MSDLYDRYLEMIYCLPSIEQANRNRHHADPRVVIQQLYDDLLVERYLTRRGPPTTALRPKK